MSDRRQFLGFVLLFADEILIPAARHGAANLFLFREYKATARGDVGSVQTGIIVRRAK